MQRLSRFLFYLWLNTMEFLAVMWHAVVTTVWKFNGNIFPSKRRMIVNLEVRPNMLVTLNE